MTEIALRTYNQEIKDLIDHAHFDEAIAHCQHILETFPRHIETYRLLGKAFLEQGRHGDAADVFQRVLSAIPEDWLSHVAMAIVREDESNLDMAIWHMERAYEVNPSNPTVQQEVRRLRGRRDGVEPPKLRLTRSALARMYIKGGLYGQAIAEIRSALSEDPDRPDLQILLASALYDSGAVQEAADICNTILQKLPYCLEANRILGLVLLASNKQDDAEKLFQRIESLDPYIDLEMLKKEKRIGERAGQEVTLSRLEYEGQEKTVRTKQPSWASSLGLKIEEPKQQQAIPDWLATASQQSAVSSSTPKPSATSPDAAIPSWLDQAAAAMGPAAPEVSGPGGSVETPPPAEPMPIARTATGELPDWIQKQANPAEPAAAEKPSAPLPNWLSTASMPPSESIPTTSNEGLPDWLSTAAAAPAAPPSKPAPEPTTNNDTLPDWIKTSSLSPEQSKEKISDIPDWLSAPPPPSVEALPSTSLPEWTKPETKTSPLGVEPSNIPDWLSSSQPSSDQIGPEPDWLKQTAGAPPAAESVPDWMKDVSPVEPAAQPSPENIPDWLREPSAPASKPVEIVPEWMRSEETPAPVAAKPIPPGIKPAPAEDIPEWMKPEPSEMPVLPPSKPVFGAKAETPAEKTAPPPAQASMPDASLPDWMNAPTSEKTGFEGTSQEAEAEAVPEANLPDWLKGTAPTRASPLTKTAEPVEPSQLPGWLKAPGPEVEKTSPAAPPPAAPQPAQTAMEPELGEAEAAPEIELPDWLKAVPAATSAPAVEKQETAETPVEPAPEAGLPDWLKGGEGEQARAYAPAAKASQPPVEKREPAETQAEPVAEAELPDWLKGGAGTQARAPVSVAESGSGKAPGPPVEPAPAQPAPPAAVSAEPTQPAAEKETAPAAPAEPGPAHVTPTTGGGIDLPDWLVSQIQGKPKETTAAPAAEKASGPLPDWLKPAAPSQANQPVVDWDKAASQQLPPAPVDATRPATGVSSKPPQKPAGGTSEIPSWLDKSKPTGSDTVARWLDRRLKTSTLSSLDEATLKGGVKPAEPPPSGKTGTQLPTWLDTQKPGGSDTVVRWMDKRETGSLRKTPTATFSSVSKSAIAAQEMKPPSPVETPPVPSIGTEDTVTSKRTPAPAEPAQAPAIPQKETPPVRQAVVQITAPPIETAALKKEAIPAEEDEDGAFVPPPEWLQKALGSAVAEVPPIPKKQTGGLKPGTVSPVSSAVHAPAAAEPAAPVPTPTAAPSVAKKPAPPPPEKKPAVPVRATSPAEEPAPAPAAKTGSWVPLAPEATAPAAKREKAPRKTARKKSRKLTGVEIEALIREARIYLETDLQKASEAYQQVIEDPQSAEVVVGDLTTYLEQDPASPQLWNLLGDACSRAGRLQDAYRAYAEALRRM
jgi:tetratricopeptide (TPR) repeat protein